jgi:hypothetical protein
MKRISKIGISLLIALCFLLPTSAVLADGGFEADKDNQRELYGEKIESERRGPEVKIADGHPVIPQATFTDILGFYLEACVGNDLYPVVGDAVIPYESCYEPMFKLETIEAPSIYEPEI